MSVHTTDANVEALFQVRNNLRVVLPSQQNRGGPEEAVVVSIFKYEASLTFMSRFHQQLVSCDEFFLLQNGLQALNYGSNSQAPFQVEYWILPGAKQSLQAVGRQHSRVCSCKSRLDFLYIQNHPGWRLPRSELVFATVESRTPASKSSVSQPPIQSNPCEPSTPVIKSKPPIHSDQVKPKQCDRNRPD